MKIRIERLALGVKRLNPLSGKHVDKQLAAEFDPLQLRIALILSRRLAGLDGLLQTIKDRQQICKPL